MWSMPGSAVTDSARTCLISRLRPAYQRCLGSQSANGSIADSSVGGSGGLADTVTGLPLVGLRADELEPVEPVARHGQQVRQLPDGRERHPAGELDRRVAGPVLQVQLDRL